MTAYADESYYKTEYLCGRKAVITSAFAYYAREATLIINAYTGSNIDDTKDIIEPVKLCCCEVAELMYKADNMSGSEGITSEKVGDVSRSYESCEVRKSNLHDVLNPQYISILQTQTFCTEVFDYVYGYYADPLQI